MKTTLRKADLRRYINHLLSNYLPVPGRNRSVSQQDLDLPLERLDYCFQRIELKYYKDADGTLFDHLNTDHMASFLYFLGNSIWKNSEEDNLPTRIFYLNKILHGLDLYHQVSMPDVFLLLHPVGTVIGRATFSNFLLVSQNCTIGAKTIRYPSFEEGVALNANVSVIGDCHIGKSVVLGAGTSIIDRSVPADSICLGQFPNNRLIPNTIGVIDRYFKMPR